MNLIELAKRMSESDLSGISVKRRTFLFLLTTTITTMACSKPKPLTNAQIPVAETLLADRKHLNITNEAAIMRAATVRFLVSGNRLGHGCLVVSNGNFFIYTAGHVADALKSSRDTRVKIAGVGLYSIDPGDFYTHWPKLPEENETATFYHLRGDQEEAVRFASDERILQPLTFAKRRINPGEIVAIPREELGVYTLYKNEKFLSDSNRHLLKSPNIDATRICAGDSGSPALQLPLNGEVFGVLIGANDLKPENAFTEKICSDTVFVRPNG